FPVRVVEAMTNIILEAEGCAMNTFQRPVASPNSRTFLSDAICFSAAKTAEEIRAKAIVGMTSSGYTAFKVSSYRPQNNIHIYIFSDRMHMLATLNLVWGVRCFYYDRFTSTDETIIDVTEILKNSGFLEPGDVVINTASMPLHKRYRTNMLKVTTIE
ncbi:MAG: hypothetical protein RL386_2086, partial [Bacteroidota bacterium]